MTRIPGTTFSDVDPPKLTVNGTLSEVERLLTNLVEMWGGMAEGDAAMSCNSPHQHERNMARARQGRLDQCAEDVKDVLKRIEEMKRYDKG